MNKWTLTLLLAAFSALPVAAQVNPNGTNPKCPVCQTNQAAVQAVAKQEGQTSARLNAQVERAVTHAAQQAQPQATCSCRCCRACGQPDEPEIPVIFTQEEEPLSEAELIDAEEELAILRSRKDSNASFEKYPYLLDPAYRRAESPAQKDKIRAHYSKDKPGQFTPPYSRGETWARKVGL